MELAAVCEAYRVDLLGQPANAVTSAAFVAAAVAIAAAILVRRERRDALHDRRLPVYAALVAAIGVGSFIQHGPNPDWQAYAHDLPLAAAMMFVATDAASDLTGRELSPIWWIIPSVAMIPVVAAGSAASTAVQAAMGTAAIGLNLMRAWWRPALRKTLIAALAILVVGAAFGSLTDRTSLCQPDSLLQGHAVWHVLAAAALWRLAATVGVRHATTILKPLHR